MSNTLVGIKSYTYNLYEFLTQNAGSCHSIFSFS